MDFKQQGERLAAAIITLENRESGKEDHFEYYPNNRSVYRGKYLLL